MHPTNEHRDKAGLKHHIWLRNWSGVPAVLETAVKNVMKGFNIKAHRGDERTVILALVKVLPWRVDMREWH